MTLGIRMHGLSPEPHSLAEGQTTQDQLKKNKTIKVLLSLGGTIQKLEKDKQGELGRERTRHHPVSFLCFYTALNLCFWEHFFFSPRRAQAGLGLEQGLARSLPPKYWDCFGFSDLFTSFSFHSTFTTSLLLFLLFTFTFCFFSAALLLCFFSFHAYS